MPPRTAPHPPSGIRPLHSCRRTSSGHAPPAGTYPRRRAGIPRPQLPPTNQPSQPRHMATAFAVALPQPTLRRHCPHLLAARPRFRRSLPHARRFPLLSHHHPLPKQPLQSPIPRHPLGPPVDLPADGMRAFACPNPLSGLTGEGQDCDRHRILSPPSGLLLEPRPVPRPLTALHSLSRQSLRPQRNARPLGLAQGAPERPSN